MVGAVKVKELEQVGCSEEGPLAVKEVVGLEAGFSLASVVTQVACHQELRVCSSVAYWCS